MSERVFPDPSINMETETYWQGCSDGKLLIKSCGDCGMVHFYPRAICPHCLSDNTEWLKASGKGHIYSYSVTRRAKVPYVIAYIRLEEGVTMLSNIIDADFSSLAVNLPVEVAFSTSESGQALPVFRLAEG